MYINKYLVVLAVSLIYKWLALNILCKNEFNPLKQLTAFGMKSNNKKCNLDHDHAWDTFYSMSRLSTKTIYVGVPQSECNMVLSASDV